MAKSSRVELEKIRVNGMQPITKSKVVKPYRTEQGMDLKSVVGRYLTNKSSG